MIQLRSSASLVFALLLVSLAGPLAVWADTGARTGRWAHEGNTALQPDERVKWGRLDNGFRYALLPHAGAPGRVSMRLVVLAGSLDERPDERGIAHFTEHMAFRGTAEFKWEDMVGFFQRLGMEYGSDVNAITTFDHTSYMLEFKENDPQLLAEGLRLFRNFASTVQFHPPHVDHERRVVQSELRRTDNFFGRGNEATFPVIFRGLTLSERMPIGTPESLRDLKREQFLEFYRRCYRPDLMILVAAGDIDLPAFEEMVTAQFSQLVRPAEPIPERNEGRLETRRQLRAGYYRITDIMMARAQAASVQLRPRTPDSRESYIEQERRSFALGLLGDRLEASIPEGNGATASYESMLGYDIAQAAITLPSPLWERGIMLVDEIIRSTYERGFEQRELEAPKRRWLTLTGHMLEQAPTLDPNLLAENLSNSITEHRVYLGYEREWTWTREWLESVTLKDLHQSYRAAWDLDRMAFHLAGDLSIEGGERKILQEIERSRRGGLRVLRPQSRKESEFTLARWGSPTKVVESRESEDLDAKFLRFGNNVRVNFVQSKQEPGLVNMLVRVGNGLLDMPGNQPALKDYGLQTLLASGTTHYSVEQISDLVEDHLLHFSFDAAEPDAFSFRGLAATEKIDVFLGLVTDVLYRPRFETPAHRAEKTRAFIDRISSSMGLGQGMRALNDHLFKDDPRFASGTANDYIGLSSIDVRNWLQGPLSKGYVEATIVGDITEEKLIAMISRTLGSLAPRAAEKELPARPKPVKISARPGFERIEFVGEQNLGIVVGTWPVTGAQSARDHAALHLLSKLLDNEIRHDIRDELGLAYAPSTEYTAYDGMPDFALIQAHIDCAPSEANRIAKLVEEIAARIAADGVSQGQFIGSRGIMKGQLKQAFKDNGFLLQMLARAQERPQSVVEAVSLKQGLIEAITIEEVNAWAAKVLAASNSRTAAIVPKPFIGIFQTGGK